MNGSVFFTCTCTCVKTIENARGYLQDFCSEANLKRMKSIYDWCFKFFVVVYLSTDEKETQLAFRKHFDHQLELYKSVVSRH